MGDGSWYHPSQPVSSGILEEKGTGIVRAGSTTPIFRDHPSSNPLDRAWQFL